MADEATERKVLTFKAREERPPVVRRRPTWASCRHLYAEVDDVARTLTCTQCQALLDPIQFLAQLSLEWAERDYKLDQMAEYEAKRAKQRERERERRAQLLERERARGVDVYVEPGVDD